MTPPDDREGLSMRHCVRLWIVGTFGGLQLPAAGVPIPPVLARNFCSIRQPDGSFAQFLIMPNWRCGLTVRNLGKIPYLRERVADRKLAQELQKPGANHGDSDRVSEASCTRLSGFGLGGERPYPVVGCDSAIRESLQGLDGTPVGTNQTAAPATYADPVAAHRVGHCLIGKLVLGHEL